jgi:hypothetical protein
MNTHVFLEKLRSIVGPANVLTEGDLTGYELDWRKRERGKALAVVRPKYRHGSGVYPRRQRHPSGFKFDAHECDSRA